MTDVPVLRESDSDNEKQHFIQIKKSTTATENLEI